MTQSLYAMAYATDNRIEAPSFCLVGAGEQLIQRIRTLAGMAHEFKMESISDHYPVIWETSAQAPQFKLEAPSFTVTQHECWWSATYKTQSGTEGFFTERFNTLRLLQKLERNCGDFCWSADDQVQIKLRQRVYWAQTLTANLLSA